MKSNFVKTSDGARIRVLDLEGGGREREVILWAHAAGFSSESYLPLLESLRGRFSVFALDFRGHGKSRLPPGCDPRMLALDLLWSDLLAAIGALREKTGLAGFVLAGHSLGVAAALQIAMSDEAGCVDRMILFDPPVFPPPDDPLVDEVRKRMNQRIAGILRQRDNWEGYARFAEQLEAHPAFARWDAGMRGAYVRAHLKVAGPSMLEAWCSKEVEIAAHQCLADPSVCGRLGRVRAPVKLICADSTADPVAWAPLVQPLVAAGLPKCRLTLVRGATHMLPFERPEFCRSVLLD